MVRFAAVTPRPLIAPHTVVGEHTHVLADGRVRCDVCPRACTMREGQPGFCFVREARAMVSGCCKEEPILLSVLASASGLDIKTLAERVKQELHAG